MVSDVCLYLCSVFDPIYCMLLIYTTIQQIKNFQADSFRQLNQSPECNRHQQHTYIYASDASIERDIQKPTRNRFRSKPNWLRAYMPNWSYYRMKHSLAIQHFKSFNLHRLKFQMTFIHLIESQMGPYAYRISSSAVWIDIARLRWGKSQFEFDFEKRRKQERTKKTEEKKIVGKKLSKNLHKDLHWFSISEFKCSWFAHFHCKVCGLWWVRIKFHDNRHVSRSYNQYPACCCWQRIVWVFQWDVQVNGKLISNSDDDDDIRQNRVWV